MPGSPPGAKGRCRGPMGPASAAAHGAPPWSAPAAAARLVRPGRRLMARPGQIARAEVAKLPLLRPAVFSWRVGRASAAGRATGGAPLGHWIWPQMHASRYLGSIEPDDQAFSLAPQPPMAVGADRRAWRGTLDMIVRFVRKWCSLMGATNTSVLQLQIWSSHKTESMFKLSTL